MKKIFYSVFCVPILLSAMALASCSDFFDPETEDELNGEDYISSNTEMYTGFLGIMTKLQAIGDKEILLTETRGELVEPTDNSIQELIAIYNYDTDLHGNSYADPSGYYEVIIACNDYLTNMVDYRDNPDVDDDIWQDLVSSAVHIKVWTYKTLGEIYGKAVWFDDPITKVTEITETNGFQLMEISALIDKCLALMDSGVEGVSSDRTIDWIEWLDPDNITSIASSSYRKWNYMVPPYEGLYAELCLWKGACLDATGQDATTYYKSAADLLLNALNTYIDSESYASSGYWLPTAYTAGHYRSFWDYAQPYPQETVAALIYDYTYNQTNTLLKHFSNEYPNKYLLRPSEYGINRFLDTDFSPGASTQEDRYKVVFGISGGQKYISKFRSVSGSIRANAYQDDVHIFLYRAAQYHIMLAEALNHLSRFTAMNGVLNTGVTTEIFVDGDAEWEGFTRNWTNDAEWGTRKYPSLGLRLSYTGLTARSVKTDINELGKAATFRYNDEAILDEAILEFACEGKTYAMMNRMALRYDDLSIISDRICGKYEASGMSAGICGKILAGGNWVPYDLNLDE